MFACDFNILFISSIVLNCTLFNNKLTLRKFLFVDNISKNKFPTTFVIYRKKGTVFLSEISSDDHTLKPVDEKLIKEIVRQIVSKNL